MGQDVYNGDDLKEQKAGGGGLAGIVAGSQVLANSFNFGPTLFQSEQGTGLTSTPPASQPVMQTYHDKQYTDTNRGQYDLSHLPQGAAGTTEALKNLLHRDPTPTEVSNCRAYLDTLAFSEGTSVIGLKKNGGQGYDVQVGGKIISDLSHHPGTVVQLNSTLASSAFGRYQFLRATWDTCAKALNLKDMSPAAQDAGALYLIQQAHGLDDVLKGDFRNAVKQTGGVWASLPGSNLGQGQQRYDKLLAVYQHSGGLLEGQTVAQIDQNPGSTPALTSTGTGFSRPNLGSLKAVSIGNHSGFDLAIGDSIGVLAQHAGVPGTEGKNPSITDATAAVSRSPSQIVAYIKTLPPGALKGKNVLLSSGASNNPDEAALAKEQIQLLKEKGADTVTMLGVGPREDYVRKNINGQLAQIAKDNGANFAGPLQGTGVDKVHPAGHAAVVDMVNTARQALDGSLPKQVASAPAKPGPANSSLFAGLSFQPSAGT